MKKGIENKNKSSMNNIFYKTNPRSGISLIVLVITIIIIIILAAAVIVSIVNNNPISEANEARIKSDVANMQSIFTNAVGKVMAENQDVISIEASPLNTVTSGDKSAVGNAVYKFADGTSGEIIFDTLQNNLGKYYTGRRLPLYKQKTTWYVDEDGIISLEVGNKKYGDGKIIKSIKIIASVMESEDFVKTKATVKIEISSEDDIESIKFGGNSIEVPERKEGKYELEIEVIQNGEYEIEAVGKGGGKGTAKVIVNEIDNINSQIKIEPTVTTTADYVKGNIKLEITYSGDIESIKINGESITVPSKLNGKYTVNKEVLENGLYNVEVKGKDGTINKIVVKVTDITEDMDIWNRADMENFRNKVNSGRTFETKKATVRANIDLGCSSSKKWTPVGTYTSDTSNKPFKGTFEGNNYTISNLYVDTTAVCQGLFGYGLNCTIKNVNVSGTVKGGNSTAGIIGYMTGTISNCKNSVTVTGVGEWNTGGIVGNLEGKISDCTNSGAVSGIGNVGGIAGWHKDTISGCRNNSKITGTGNHVGGIVGGNEGNTISCKNYMSVTGNSLVGGIIGYNAGAISNCNSYGTFGAIISGNANNVGGIAGHTTEIGSITSSSNSATIQSSNQHIGGIVGNTLGPVTSCKNSGSVSALSYVGGIAGWNQNTLSNSSNSGAIYSSGGFIGGLVGTNAGSIYRSFNKGNLTTGGTVIAGISGENMGIIDSCYNVGNIHSDGNDTFAGITGWINSTDSKVSNCYNVGTITFSVRDYLNGGIIGNAQKRRNSK